MAIVTSEQIIKVLRQYNPWWRNPVLIKEDSKPQKRLAYYEVLRILEHESIRRFAVLSGMRRVGKTTILYQLMEHLIDTGTNPRNILYVSFDNPLLKFSTVEEVLDLYESIQPLFGIRYVFLDEVQYTENWEQWMKVLYDRRSDLRIVATGSASPLLEKGSSESGTGRWTVLKIPTLSFYEYCKLLHLAEPAMAEGLRLSEIASLSESDMGNLMDRFTPLLNHFNRYLTVGGFPELVLAHDDAYAQRMLREDVVDKVIKRDVLTLFNIRNPLLMEKLFLYLCMNSTGIFNASSAAKELNGISATTLDNYLAALEMSNLIYLAKPMEVGSKGALKGRPKICIADVAIRNAVLMVDDVLSDEAEMGAMVETAVYAHVVSFYQGTSASVGYFRKLNDNQKEVDVVVELPRKRILAEVKYRNNTHIAKSDAIIELCKERQSGITEAYLITKRLDDYGIAKHETAVPVLRIPAVAFLYILGKNEADRIAGKPDEPDCGLTRG